MGGFVKTLAAGSCTPILSQQVWDAAHEFARPSNKFPGDADTGGSDSTAGEPLHGSI